MELFDLIDRNDRVTGVTNKVEAHEKGLLHRVVAVFVFNSEGELFVQVHKKSGGLYDNSVGGHVSKGESYYQAASREAREELGIAQPLKYIDNFYSDEGLRQHIFSLYSCVAEPSWEFMPNSEVERIIPMNVDQILDLMKTSPEKFTKGFINTLNHYQMLIKR